MNMKSCIALLLLCCAGAASAGVDFDRGVDVRAAVAEARAAEDGIPQVRLPIINSMTRDCRKVTFTASEELASPVINLASEVEYQNCHNSALPGQELCIPSYHTVTADAQIVITAPRELKPGQKEVFQVCLRGNYLGLTLLSPAYEYEVRREGDVFRLTPQGEQGQDRGEPEVCKLFAHDKNFCSYKCADGSIVHKPANDGRGFWGPSHPSTCAYVTAKPKP